MYRISYARYVRIRFRQSNTSKEQTNILLLFRFVRISTGRRWISWSAVENKPRRVSRNVSHYTRSCLPDQFETVFGRRFLAHASYRLYGPAERSTGTQKCFGHRRTFTLRGRSSPHGAVFLESSERQGTIVRDGK